MQILKVNEEGFSGRLRFSRLAPPPLARYITRDSRATELGRRKRLLAVMMNELYGKSSCEITFDINVELLNLKH